MQVRFSDEQDAESALRTAPQQHNSNTPSRRVAAAPAARPPRLPPTVPPEASMRQTASASGSSPAADGDRRRHREHRREHRHRSSRQASAAPPSIEEAMASGNSRLAECARLFHKVSSTTVVCCTMLCAVLCCAVLCAVLCQRC